MISLDPLDLNAFWPLGLALSFGPYFLCVGRVLGRKRQEEETEGKWRGYDAGG